MRTTRGRWTRGTAFAVLLVLVVTTGCLSPERQAHIDDIITRSYRTVFDRGPNQGARNDWTGRLATQPYHQWLVASLMNTPEYRAGLGRLNTNDFLTRSYENARDRGPDAAARAWWRTRIDNGSRSRLDLLIHLVENVGPALQNPAKPVRCARYPGGGGVWPACHPGSAGRTRDSIFVTVPGTNTRTNIANLPRMWAFLDAAHRAGHPVDAYREYGSARTYAMQDFLYRNGYPANPPGKSMHEWGLAIDLGCAGRPWSQATSGCRSWVLAHAATYGFKVHPREAWHYSSSGKAGEKDPELSMTPA